MQYFKNNKGITLTTLIITVIVMVTIAGTAVYTGMDVYQDAKEEAFMQELQILQNWVNNENSKIEFASLNDEDDDGAFDYIYDLTWENRQGLDDFPNEIKNLIGEGNGYRYFERKGLEEIGVYGVNQPVLINFTTRDIISVNGFNGKYTLSDFEISTSYNSNVIIEIDDVPIPNGFVYLTGSKDKGLTIKNIKDGNEFVWVPVEDIADFRKLEDFGKGSAPGREPDLVTGKTTTVEGKTVADLENGTTYDANEVNRKAILEDGYENTNEGLKKQFEDEYNAMVESVKAYGGFYVGRYETSWTGSTVASVATTKISQVMTAGTLLEETWTTSETSNANKATWYGLYAKQKELYKKNSSSSVVSGMIYGCQWDAIMNWMKDIPNVNDSTKKFVTDSTDMGWYSNNKSENSKYLTGKDLGEGAKNKVNNIYDLAGHYTEWTQEVLDANLRVTRGGNYYNDGSNGPASYRYRGNPTAASGGTSSRLQLYIK